MSLETRTTKEEHVKRFVDLVWGGRKEEAKKYYEEHIQGNFELEYHEKILLAKGVLNCRG